MKYCPECKAVLETRELDGVERRACSTDGCDFIVWDNPVPVVAGLVVYQDKLLLARNSHWPQGTFSMITGYLERHELPAQAIVRETREELGLDASEVKFIGHYPFIPKNQIIMAFSLRAAGEISLNHELAEIELLDFEQVAKKDFGKFMLTGEIVRDWLKTF